jgi:methylthioribose-1-phosphate isomerase
MRTIWLGADGRTVEIIDQTKLPHELVIVSLETVADAARAISTMQVRGAPLIGAAAAYGVALAIAEDPSDEALGAATAILAGTRPTAVNLRWALAEMKLALQAAPEERRFTAAVARAGAIAEADVAINRAIGEHGVGLIAEAWRRKGSGAARVDVLTHCNAGWLATVDRGTALAPVYRAHDAGIPVHVWVDETRPRNQGAGLTAWELAEHGVAHTVIVDNAAGHVMREGLVDLCIVGTDRTTAGGDVANKIGTYTKALAARDNDVPFYVALPSPTIDWEIESGAAIPIERRDSREVTHVEGWTEDGRRIAVRLTPSNSPAANYSFDVTPARLVTGLITERGVCAASRVGLSELFPEYHRVVRGKPCGGEGDESASVISSWPGLARPSTPGGGRKKGVGARIKSAQDGS